MGLRADRSGSKTAWAAKACVAAAWGRARRPRSPHSGTAPASYVLIYIIYAEQRAAVVQIRAGSKHGTCGYSTVSQSFHTRAGGGGGGERE